jgi:hypothetical protein
MPTGEVIAEWKGKLNSLKVLPFEAAGAIVRYEMTWLGEISGRLSGNEIGTDYISISPDGSGISDYFGVLTTSQGEIVLVEGHGTPIPAEQGLVRARFGIKFRTVAPRLAWLTKMGAAFESEGDWSGDLSAKVFSGRYLEWK